MAVLQMLATGQGKGSVICVRMYRYFCHNLFIVMYVTVLSTRRVILHVLKTFHISHAVHNTLRYAQFLKFQKAVPMESIRGQNRKEAVWKRVSQCNCACEVLFTEYSTVSRLKSLVLY